MKEVLENTILIDGIIDKKEISFVSKVLDKYKIKTLQDMSNTDESTWLKIVQVYQIIFSELCLNYIHYTNLIFHPMMRL